MNNDYFVTFVYVVLLVVYTNLQVGKVITKLLIMFHITEI